MATNTTSTANTPMPVVDSSVYTRAFTFLKERAEQGIAEAQYLLSKTYLLSGTVEHTKLAKQWLQKSAEQGHLEAQRTIPMSFKVEGFEKMAFTFIKERAEQDIAEAQYLLGMAITFSNYKAALYWLQKSAEQEHLDAQYELATMYFLGNGCLKNPILAFSMYEKTAKLGHPKSQYNLGQLYYKGLCPGYQVNKQMAAHWIKKAYDNGYEKAALIWEELELWKYI